MCVYVCVCVHKITNIKKENTCRVVVAHAFNLNTWEAEVVGFLSSRPAWCTSEFQDRTTQRNPVSKTKQNKTKQKPKTKGTKRKKKKKILCARQ